MGVWVKVCTGDPVTLGLAVRVGAGAVGVPVAVGSGVIWLGVAVGVTLGEMVKVMLGVPVGT
jgi:hypothetical protein